MAEYLSPAVYIEEIASGNKPLQAAGTSTGAFVGIAEKGPIGDAVAIQNFAQFVSTFGTYIDDGYLAFSVKSFFDEGGSSCYVVRTCHYTGATPDATATRRIFRSSTPQNSIRVSAASPGSWGNDIGIEVTNSGADAFSIAVQFKGAAIETEVFANLSMDPAHERYFTTIIESNSKWIVVADEGATTAPTRPAATTGFELLTASGGTAGTDGLAGIVSTDFTGDAVVGSGLHAFDKVESIRIVAIPEALAPREAHVSGMAYCAGRGDCFYIADPPEGVNTADMVLHYKTAQGDYAGANAFNSKYGALYTPWIQVFDPRSGGRLAIPPSGAVAGRYAATDAARGVHKAPAGIEDGRLRSVLGLEVEFTATDQEKLNPKGINVIRKFPGVGNVLWGVRTVSSDPEWRYLNVRRLFLFLETSILQSTSWIVFEPNDRALWKSIIRNVSSFLKIQWLQGALVGATAEEAFYVKCDEETNPQESIDLGRVITEIGIAPSKAAEFVIFRISQFSGGAEVTA